MKRPRSLTARIALLFAAGTSAVLLGLGALVAGSVDAHFRDMDRAQLEEQLHRVRVLLRETRDAAGFDALPGRLEMAMTGPGGWAVAVRAADGRLWFASRDLGLPAPALDQADTGQLVTWRAEGRDQRGLAVSAGTGGGATVTVAIALDISHHEHFLTDFRRGLALAIALAALLTAGLGWLAARAGLAPLRRMTRLAEALSASHLGERLPTDRLAPELLSLTLAFNAMLDRLQASFERLTRFSADLAHELRTPVSNLMTQTQVALSRARSAEAYRDTLQSAAEEYERLSRMIADMLFLARADHEGLALACEPVDLAAEAASLVEFHAIGAEERGIRIRVEGAATITGDRGMLRRALSNLIANALRHCPEGDEVMVHLAAGADGIEVTVENPGDLPAEHLPRLFDRFYTADPARRAEGAGLGLAIVRSIVTAHGGTISAAASDHRVRFSLRLPVQPPPPQSGRQV